MGHTLISKVLEYPRRHRLELSEACKQRMWNRLGGTWEGDIALYLRDYFMVPIG